MNYQIGYLQIKLPLVKLITDILLCYILELNTMIIFNLEYSDKNRRRLATQTYTEYDKVEKLILISKYKKQPQKVAKKFNRFTNSI